MTMNQEKKNLLVFGYGLSVIMVFFVFRHGMKHGFQPASYFWFVMAFSISLVTAIRYQWLKPFYSKWMKAAHFLGNIISTLVFSILFFFVFGITGIVLRLLRKDLLNQKTEPRASTYWIDRKAEEFNRDSYRNQF